MSKPERIIRMPELLDRTGLCKAQIYNMVGRDEFPAPVKLGARARGWLESELTEWMRSRPLVDIQPPRSKAG